MLPGSWVSRIQLSSWTEPSIREVSILEIQMTEGKENGIFIYAITATVTMKPKLKAANVNLSLVLIL